MTERRLGDQHVPSRIDNRAVRQHPSFLIKRNRVEDILLISSLGNYVPQFPHLEHGQSVGRVGCDHRRQELASILELVAQTFVLGANREGG